MKPIHFTPTPACFEPLIIKHQLLLLFFFLFPVLFFPAQEASANRISTKYRLKENLLYRPSGEAEKDAYKQEQCRPYIYYPAGGNNFIIITWFGFDHGAMASPAFKLLLNAIQNKIK